MKRALPFLTLLCLLLNLFSNPRPMQTAMASSLPTGQIVRIESDAMQRMARAGIAPQQIIDYGTFSWAVLSPNVLQTLEDASINYEVIPDAYTLNLGGQSFDPLTRQLDFEPSWAPRETYPPSPDLQLVQLAGPVKAEWIDDLQANGLEIVQYIHPFSYVVWGTPIELAHASQTTSIRWTGAFAPAFRVQPQNRILAASSIPVHILLYLGADTQSLIKQIVSLGGIFQGSSAMDATFEVAAFELDGMRFADVAALPGVYSIQPVPTDGGLRGEMSNQINAGNYGADNLAFTGYQEWLSTLGLSGQDVIIANVDSGVDNNHPDLVNNMLPCVGSSCAGIIQSNHGTHTAGIMVGDGASGVVDAFGFLRGLGMAPGASLIEQLYTPTYTYANGMLTLIQQSYANGASISGNSWGPSGTAQGYDLNTRLVDIGVRDADPLTPDNQQFNYVLSIMNGYGSISSQGSPDEAKNIFSVGSTVLQSGNGSQYLNINDLSANTAHGPALDGRTIPHMVAPGCYVDSTIIDTYNLMCGTSMASPHVSGAVALFIEKYRGLYGVDPSPALIKAAFLPVAHDLAGNKDADGLTLGHPFDSKQGWGRLDAAAVLDPSGAVMYLDAPLTFDNTGETWQQDMIVTDPSQPLRLMLVWTDAPGHGLGGTTPAWNNDLDLSIMIYGQTYKGNNFDPATGWSVADGAADSRNNTEGIFIGPIAEGRFTLYVTAGNINSDGVPGSGDGTDQDFALVCYNCAPYVVSDTAMPVDDHYETYQDDTLIVKAPGVLTNDIYDQPDHLIIVEPETQPSHGSLELDADGSFIYVPDKGFYGLDSFNYNMIHKPPHKVIGQATVYIRVLETLQYYLPLILK